jgi:hypothetical protein
MFGLAAYPDGFFLGLMTFDSFVFFHAFRGRWLSRVQARRRFHQT